MSYRGSSTKRIARKLFSFTRWGAVFFLLSLFILIVGALRMELAAILWGSAFTLLAVYGVVANGITQSILRSFFRRAPDPMDFTLSAAGVFPGISTAAQLNAELPRCRAPGIKVRFEILLYWPGREPLGLSCDLRGGRNHREFELSPAYRGLYRSREVRIVLSDLLGFTRFPLTLPLNERLRVFPAVQPEAVRRPPSLEGGQEEHHRTRQRRNEELLEVRKYFPGDDIRKVHWKVFAHTSELFLRIGEETPPPESRLLVILDSAPSKAVPPRFEADYLDSLVEICAATVLEVLTRGYQVFFARCDSPRLRQVTLETKLQLLGELAGVWWSDRYVLELPRRHPGQVFLFSSPGSGNLSRIFEDLKKRGGEVKLYFPDLPVSAEQPRYGWLRELVFRPAAEHGGARSPLAGAELERYQSKLDQEIERWGRRGNWKVVG
jgi:uncharacterized protein (DUF58 family)